MEEDRNASRSALFKVRNGTSSGNPGGRKMKLPFSPRFSSRKLMELKEEEFRVLVHLSAIASFGE